MAVELADDVLEGAEGEERQALLVHQAEAVESHVGIPVQLCLTDPDVDVIKCPRRQELSSGLMVASRLIMSQFTLGTSPSKHSFNAALSSFRNHQEGQAPRTNSSLTSYPARCVTTAWPGRPPWSMQTTSRRRV